jgi:hypothetical protein
MTTVRIYQSNKRISTGKEWNGKFLQVYPEMTEYASREAWVENWKTSILDSLRVEASVPSQNQVVRPLVSAKPVEKPRTTPSEKDWKYTDKKKYTAPPGTYYIGDLCYALYENLYDNVFGGLGGYSGGLYQKGESFFMVDSTAFGDGAYHGSDRFEYLVDAGIIGICSADIIDPDNHCATSGGKLHFFKKPVHIEFGSGVFRFHQEDYSNNLTINTLNNNDSDEDDY